MKEISLERQDYYALRNKAKLLMWMELCLKKTEGKNNLYHSEKDLQLDPHCLCVSCRNP